MRAATASERQDTAVERLVEHCCRRRLLIVLDNCEHVVDSAARLTEALLARCPHLTVLATSREPLGVPGETLRPVEPLSEPAALRLLADRGAAARPGFRVDADEETAAACAEICRRLDGLPLAIELAAARLRMLTPRQIADRLDDRFRLLTSGSRTVLPRQQTLRAVVDWSWDLLDADERDVLGRLSVFAGGCDLAAAEAVCGPAALEALGSLVDKSLVVATPVTDRLSGDGMRYRLLETVAEYAGERLDEAGGRASAARAHLTYYRELARTTDPLLRGAQQLAAIERLEREYENLRTALRHAVAERDVEQEALCLALSLVWYWQMRDLRVEARQLVRRGDGTRPGPLRRTGRPRPAGVGAVHVRAAPDDRRGPRGGPARSAPGPSGLHGHGAGRVAEPGGQAQTARHRGHLRAGDAADLFAAPACSGSTPCCSPVTWRGCARSWTPPCGPAARPRGTSGSWPAGLQMRANMLANRTDWAGDAVRDADESLEIYRRLGDGWGMAEALSGRARGPPSASASTGSRPPTTGPPRNTPSGSARTPRWTAPRRPPRQRAAGGGRHGAGRARPARGDRPYGGYGPQRRHARGPGSSSPDTSA
ncbi:hypothetical protein STENM36S_01306 [Streptomyces tendae]